MPFANGVCPTSYRRVLPTKGWNDLAYDYCYRRVSRQPGSLNGITSGEEASIMEELVAWQEACLPNTLGSRKRGYRVVMDFSGAGATEPRTIIHLLASHHGNPLPSAHEWDWLGGEGMRLDKFPNLPTDCLDSWDVLDVHDPINIMSRVAGGEFGLGTLSSSNDLFAVVPAVNSTAHESLHPALSSRAPIHLFVISREAHARFSPELFPDLLITLCAAEESLSRALILEHGYRVIINVGPQVQRVAHFSAEIVALFKESLPPVIPGLKSPWEYKA